MLARQPCSSDFNSCHQEQEVLALASFLAGRTDSAKLSKVGGDAPFRSVGSSETIRSCVTDDTTAATANAHRAPPA